MRETNALAERRRIGLAAPVGPRAERCTGVPSVTESLIIALSKGRICEASLPLLEHAGIRPCDDPWHSRKLRLATSRPELSLLVLRAQDVPTFVEHGAADIGIAGKDMLLEYSGDGLYEPLDLGIARCRMVVAGRPGGAIATPRLRVATKYVNTARHHFAARGIQVEVIRLYGSMELAPFSGLADQIVDLVDTGSTLSANGLVEIETIAHISSRVIVNKASMKMKHRLVTEYLGRLEAASLATAGQQ